MRAKHVTSESIYRDPFGAAPAEHPITLSIDVWDEPDATAYLRIWEDDTGETLIAMTAAAEPTAQGATRFTATFTPSSPGVLWYRFNVTAANGEVWMYGATPERSCGEGAFAFGEPPSFQITVYRHTRSVFPDWYKNGIVYQVFPDRFARGADWRERASAAIGGPDDVHVHGPRRAVVDDWYATPRYKKDADGRITEWSFYGGTLEGIRERLPYLESLGVTVIYLNPIFDAASSHRYDTADYLRIDPALGDEQTFTRLCDEAAARGMSVILDGVFNHTGCDSRYFNRYGNYPELGAYQSEDSPYRAWYKFDEDGNGTYSCWWGVDDLPDLREDNPDYRQLICGRDGVVRHWMRAGARGWRLDVADELPDDFIADIKGAELAERDDALLIGEVWEDATTKVAYGQLRKYFQGNELDGVMNYPMRHAILDFITGKITATRLADIMNQLRENYPGEAFFSLLNLLGSHDRVRLMNILGDSPHRSTLTDDERAAFKLDESHRSLAVSRLWVAALMQMTLPGVPCIYYGDEAGMEGYADPYNRAAFPWGREDGNCTTIYRNAIAIRKCLPVLVSGYFEPFAANDDVFGYWRYDGETTVCVLINRSLSQSHTVRVPLRGGSCVADVITGNTIGVVGAGTGAEAEAFLWPLGTSVLYFHDAERMQAPLPHGMGMLAHITSVPGVAGVGAAGEGTGGVEPVTAAGAGVAGVGVPGTPTVTDTANAAGAASATAHVAAGAGSSNAEQADPKAVASLAGSPGDGTNRTATMAAAGAAEPSSPSDAAAPAADATATATAGQGIRSASGTVGEVASATSGHGTLGAPAHAFVDYLAAAGQRYWQILPVNPTDEFGSPYAGLSAFAGNTALLEGASSAGGTTTFATDFEGTPEYRRFLEDNDDWLLPYATFRAIKELVGDELPWQAWPERYREWSPKLAGSRRLKARVEHHCRLQFEFNRQWSELRAYANEHGVAIIGDMPMYVSADSSDVWAEREIFNLDAAGHPALMAGAPPDNMSTDGQIWGNPTYRWDVLKASGYDWWMRRFKRMFELYDYVRLDHFLGFSSYYTIPLGASAKEGWWNFGPGVDLFATAYERFGPLPVIAEDLGVITPAVRALIAATGVPGMDVVQFFDGDPRAGYHPKPGKIVYPSTHDTQTLLGWVEGRYGLGDPQDRASGPAAEGVAAELLDACLASPASVVIVPLQDVLALDNSARMNVPGVPDGNWSWQASAASVEASVEHLRELAERHHRA